MHESSDRSFAGATALVTGASDGVGLEIARALAGRGARVLMPVRDRAKGDRAIARIRETAGDADIELRDLDLASLASVASLADDLIAEEDPVDLFVMNAGIVLLGDPARYVTADGFELHFQTNFLGHYALTRALLPLLRSSRARLAVQCSLAVARGRIDWDDLQLERRYSPFRAYAASKVALGAFGVELARRSVAGRWGLTVHLCHPGVVPDTGIAPAMRAKSAEGLGAVISRRLGHTPASAAQSALAALASMTMPPRYFGPSGPFGMGGAPRELKIPRAVADASTGAFAWRVGEEFAVGAAV